LQVEGIPKRANVAAQMYAIVEQKKVVAEEKILRMKDENIKRARRDG